MNALENNQSFANFSVEEKLNEYCENNKDDIEGIKEAKKLASKQIEEKNRCIENIEKEEKVKTIDSLKQEMFIDMTRIFVYEYLWINHDLEKNWAIANFFKGIVDEIIIWNFEFALQVRETKWKILIDIFKQLLTIEWLKAVLEWIWASIWDLFSWDAYRTGKSVGELWILFLWITWTYKVWKLAVKWVKKGWTITKAWVMAVGITAGFETWLTFSKNIVHGNMDKKRMVSGAPVRRNMKKIEEAMTHIIPKKKFNAEEMAVKDIIYRVEKDKPTGINNIWTKKYLNAELKKFSQDFWLQKKVTVKDYIHSGWEWALFEIRWQKIEWADMLVKIPVKGDTNIWRIRHHEEFYKLHQDWKEYVYPESLFKNQPSSIKIPKVINHKWFYVMENLKDYVAVGEAVWKESIKRNFRSEWIRKKIDDLNHTQMYALGRKLGIDTSSPEAYNTVRKQINPLELRTFIRYANTMWLYHWEINYEHIMVPRNPRKRWVAIVDFGKDSLKNMIHDRKDMRLWDIDFQSNFYDIHFLDEVLEWLKESWETAVKEKGNILRGKKKINKKILKEMLPVDEEVFQNLFAVIKERKLSHINKLWWEKYFNSKLKKLSRKLWLQENITLSDYIDAGENGIMVWGNKINIDGVNMAVKLPSQFADRYFPNEIKNHQHYYTVYESWKKKVHSEMWITDNVLLKVPKVKNYNGYYLTENLSNHISLERFLQRELIREKFGDKFDFDIYSLDPQELRILGTELWVEFMDTYTKVKLPLIDKKDLGLIKNFLWYANKSWLFHKDIKVDNIMVPKDISTPWESIYLVDYWEAFVDKKYYEPKDISVNDVKKTIESDVYKYRDVMFMDFLGENLVK